MSNVVITNDKTATLQVALEVQVSVAWLADTSPDLSYLGKYTDVYQDGAIDRLEKAGRYSKGEARYFVACNHVPHEPENWSHVRKEELAEVVSKYGSIEKADEAYALQDFQRMEAYERDEWYVTGCRVTVRHGSMEARDSLWGIESDCGDEHRRETEKDLTSSAMKALEEKILARLNVE